MWNKQLFRIIKTLKRPSRNLSSYQFEKINVTSPIEYVYQVELNNPDKRNTMNTQFIQDIGKCFQDLSADDKCRCIVLCGAGKVFSGGMDLVDINNSFSKTFNIDDPARKTFSIRKALRLFQTSFSSLEVCLKPVIAAVHGACIGGAVDLICSTDIRMATSDSYFQIKEVEMGLAADLGTLQRFPKLICNDSLARELIYTSRKFLADEALKIGFISGIFTDKDTLISNALKMAENIASMSPIAIQSSKAALVYSRDHSVDEGLRMQKPITENLITCCDNFDHTLEWCQNYGLLPVDMFCEICYEPMKFYPTQRSFRAELKEADWNGIMLQSEDLMKSVMAALQKTKAKFQNL